MPKSTPFGFENFVVFYDWATKYLKVYFTRGHTGAEIRACFEQYITDVKPWLKSGSIETWHCDNHGEFSSHDTDEFLRELGTRQTFIVPWNPQQNASERVNGIVLRLVRVSLAHANDAVATIWPFLVSQAELIHNSLASRSATAIMPGHSPYEMVTGNIPNLSVLRVPLCRMEATLRNQKDLTRVGKLGPRTTTCVHLCWDQKRKGYMAYVLE